MYRTIYTLAAALLLVFFITSNAQAQLFAGLFAQRRTQPTQCYVMPSGFNASQGCSFMRPQSSGVSHDQMIRLTYMVNHLSAQERIAQNTGGIRDELERLNDSMDTNTNSLRDAIFEAAMLQALIEKQNGNGNGHVPTPPVQIQPVPQQQPTTLILPQTSVPMPTPTSTQLMRYAAQNGRRVYLR